MSVLAETASRLAPRLLSDGERAVSREPACLDPLSTPGATLFHSREWAQVLSETYGHQPHYLTRGETGGLDALLPIMEVRSRWTGTKGVSLPFTDLCEPLGSAADFQALFQQALQLGRDRRWRYLELRGVPPDWLGARASVSFWGHTLDLARGEERTFHSFESSVRRAIRKAEQARLEVATGNSREDVRAYYQLHCQTRQRHGVPPQPWRFFENLQRYVLAAGHGFVVTAHQQGRAVASAVFLHAGRNATFKFGASDARYQEMRGSNLVMWQGIRRCRGLGCTRLHLGRTSRANDGLRRFKLGFGTQESSIDYVRLALPDATVVTVSDRAQGPFNQLFRLVPKWAARCVGAVLYRHIT
jgi:hypothetical protein